MPRRYRAAFAKCGRAGWSSPTPTCGLVDAIGAVLPGASWQRCRTHYARNLLSQVPKSAQPWVATLLRTVFEQPDNDAVQAQMRHVLDALEAKFPKAAAHLDTAQHDLLAFTALPREIWRQVWSNDPQERLNKEIRRRTDVVGIFPDRTAVIRLVGAVLAEQNDEWTEARRYMSLDLLAKTRLHPFESESDELLWQDELRDPAGLAPAASVTDRELELAEALMRELTGVEVDQLQDEYRHALEQLVEAKVSGGELAAPPEPAPAMDLMAALEESVRAARAHQDD